MIKETVNNIEDGNEKIKLTGNVLYQINLSIANVGLIDHKTQQNASLVEETTASMENMSQQGDELNHAVCKFKLHKIN